MLVGAAASAWSALAPLGVPTDLPSRSTGAARARPCRCYAHGMGWLLGFRVTGLLGLCAVTSLTARVAVAQEHTPGAGEHPASTRARGRPLVEFSGVAALAFGRKDAGLSQGRAFTAALLARPIPYLAVGPYYDYREFDWDARGYSGFRAPNERAWANTWGGLLRSYPVTRGRLEPYAELGLGLSKYHGTVYDLQCARASWPFVLRFGVGFDTYATRWLRIGASASATGRLAGGAYDCTEAYILNEPPGAPNTGVGAELGVSATVAVPHPRPKPGR